jgi:hypothetical protein
MASRIGASLAAAQEEREAFAEYSNVSRRNSLVIRGTSEPAFEP